MDAVNHLIVGQPVIASLMVDANRFGCCKTGL